MREISVKAESFSEAFSKAVNIAKNEGYDLSSTQIYIDGKLAYTPKIK